MFFGVSGAFYTGKPLKKMKVDENQCFVGELYYNVSTNHQEYLGFLMVVDFI
jgi:hypothetical protein